MAACVFPDYRGGSIVNLMSSIRCAFGDQAQDYPLLNGVSMSALQAVRNVVLLVIDGLGYDYLVRYGNGSVLQQHLQQRITSVAPPTTATAITTFLTGLAPQQHALTGWFTWFREIGTVLAVLPFKARFGGESLGRAGISAEMLFGHVPLFDRLNARSYSLCPDWIATSDFNRAHLGAARLVPFRGLDQCFGEIARLASEQQERKYIYAYWPGFDRLAHEHGIKGDALREHFAQIDTGFARLLDALAGTDTLMMVSADHGFVEVTEQQHVCLDAHPELKACLTLPLCGEQRLAYAYVAAQHRERFQDYVKRNLSEALSLYRSEDLLAQSMFGMGEPHPELRARIGDYILVTKEGYVIQDSILGEKPPKMVGFHGGLSEQEMYVPFILSKC